MRAAATILLAFFAFAADAHAATVSVTGATLHVTAAPGEANQVAIARSSGVLSVTDAGAPLAAGDGCTAAGAAIECASLPVLNVNVDLGDGDDTLTSTVNLALLVADGDGADRVTGGNASDTFLASPGADVYQGGGGSDTISYASHTEAVIVDLADSGFTSVENAIGGAAGDRLIGTTSTNRLQGGPGDDVLDGRTGADRLEGGTGVDTVEYTSRTAAVRADLDGNADDGQSFERDRITTDVERLLGGAGADVLTGHEGANLLVGGAGNDQLDGNGGDDSFDGGDGDDRAWGDAGHDGFTLGAGADQAWGGDGNDVLGGAAGDDSVSGDGGADSLTGGLGNDSIAGGEADDALNGESGNDTLGGGNGNDHLDGSSGDDRLDGDAGDDALHGSSGADTISGGDGNDRLLGADDGDALNGGDGDDVLDGGTGNDGLAGAAGADALAGEAGDDSLAGEAGADRVNGGDGADSLSGGVDDDVLSGGPGGDDISGDEGWDTADYAGRPEALTIDLDEQRDDGAANEGDNVRATVESVIGGAGSDRITGNAEANYLYGEAGADRLDGGDGSDRLYGGAGNDRLTGGKGGDSMDGGDGADRIAARDGSREAVRCGSARDRATTDTVDMLFGCEKRTSGTANWTSRDRPKAGRVKGVRARTGGGRFVDIPGFPGERIDRRLLADIRYLQRRYRIHISDGYALDGHAKHGEHPIGLAIDIVPGPGGSWSDIDRLARWAEPRQNRPRAPFRWVGYYGDRNHGREHHLHLSWQHTATKRGRPARTVWTLAF